MTGWRIALLVLLGALVAAGATWVAVQQRAESPPTAAATLAQPHAPVIDAAQIGTGKIAMERMPDEVGKSLETFSDEIVKNAQALEGKQARITGTCAPGSAIRIIGEDGSVRCQQLPKGVVSVSAIAATPRLSSTTTEAASVAGGAGRYQSGGADDYLVAPVTLPDGAVVTSFSYTFFDDAPEADTEAFLYRSDDQPLAVAESEGVDEQVRTVITEKVQLRRVDAGKYSYFVYFQMSAAAGARLMPISASIAYRLP
ncbi:MAG TPA: hypothetical protein VLW85_16540 [Myxococcales bacterium]|nr:hypothetical protein [Myxococcales bacterium]